MSAADNLKSILERQKEVLSSLETEIKNIESSDLVTENQNLKEDLSKHKEYLEKVKSHNLKISEENKKLRTALYEQFYNEKIQILNTVNRKMDSYYKSNVNGELNRLTSFEKSINKQIDEMTSALKTNRISAENQLYNELDEFRAQVFTKINQVREELVRKTGAFSVNRDAELAKLKEEKVTEEEIQSRIKKNNIESFIGLNIINKLGVLLLIIGVIAASQFTYFKLPDLLKGIFAFTFGIILLVVGEFLNRKKPNVFSLGITSGGIAVLYVAEALSFFEFKIIDMYPALGLCILITAGAFVLSQRYNSQTISAFAMIGGYLPIFSISGNKIMLYGAMVYFVILNILALSISVNKKWTVSSYIGFVLNVAGTIFISSIMIFGRFKSTVFSKDDLITILYIIFTFIIYTLIPVLGTMKKKYSFKNSDIVLLALNTIISSLLLYSVFYTLKLLDFTGILAILFAIVYMALGRIVERLMSNEQKARALFYITGLTFVVLTIPLQFGKAWLSFGWLIEGVVLLSYGIYKDLKDFKKSGLVISILCLASFIAFDVPYISSPLFVYKYLALTVGSIIVLGLLIYKKDLGRQSNLLFKYAVIMNTWAFFLYLIVDKLDRYLTKLLWHSNINANYLISAAMILISFAVAYITPRIRVLCDNVVKYISMVIYTVGIVAVFLLNFNSPVRGFMQDVPLTLNIIGTIELIVIAVLGILALRDLILCLVLEGQLGIEYYPLLLSSVFVVILTQNLITQYGLEFNNSVISIIYLITALAWIIFGFMKRYSFIRKFGLGLSILSVAKLFIIDLAFLSQGYKIVAYFIFGMTLIAISFVYQYFNKRIENICEVIPDEKKNNS